MADEGERQVRAAVWRQAETIPLDAPVGALAAELVASMGDRPDATKVILLATTYTAALKMIREQAELPVPDTPPPN